MSDDTHAEPNYDEVAADLAQDAKESFESSKENQHALLDAVAEQDGAPLLETQCTIYGETIPVSGRLTGELIDRITALDTRAKEMSDKGGSGAEFRDIINDVTQIAADLIDDDELTQRELYKVYRDNGVKPLRTILMDVFESLQKEEERVRGDADGFRKK